MTQPAPRMPNQGVHWYGTIQIDDAYLGRERMGGKPGRGLQNKIPIVAGVSPNEAGHPIHAKMTPVVGFSSEAIFAWAKENQAPGSAVLSDDLACFRSITMAGCSHDAIDIGGTHPNDLPQFRWINIVLGNLKTILSSTFHAFDVVKFAKRYLGSNCVRFNGAVRWRP